MHQALQGATFHIEHVVPQAAGGSDEPDNLAWACPRCNLKKSSRVEATDPETETLVPLYHPRLDSWAEHFSWKEFQLVGRTPKGRALIAAFDLNHPRLLRIRQAEAWFELFPP
jgi:hypothetical protein